MSITFSKTVKTKKDHSCFTCCETIPKGTLTEFSWGNDGVYWWRTYICDPCLLYISENDLLEDGNWLDEGCVDEHRRWAAS